MNCDVLCDLGWAAGEGRAPVGLFAAAFGMNTTAGNCPLCLPPILIGCC